MTGCKPYRKRGWTTNFSTASVRKCMQHRNGQGPKYYIKSFNSHLYIVQLSDKDIMMHYKQHLESWQRFKLMLPGAPHKLSQTEGMERYKAQCHNQCFSSDDEIFIAYAETCKWLGGKISKGMNMWDFKAHVWVHLQYCILKKKSSTF